MGLFVNVNVKVNGGCRLHAVREVVRLLAFSYGGNVEALKLSSMAND